jgi:hypothetical protein
MVVGPWQAAERGWPSQVPPTVVPSSSGGDVGGDEELQASIPSINLMPQMTKAAVFVEPERIVLDDKPMPDIGPLDALSRVTTRSTRRMGCFCTSAMVC